MPAVYEALAERDVIRSTIYSGSTGLPDVAIKPESKGRHHSISRSSALGPLAGFVAGSSSGRHVHRPSLDRWLALTGNSFGSVLVYPPSSGPVRPAMRLSFALESMSWPTSFGSSGRLRPPRSLAAPQPVSGPVSGESSSGSSALWLWSAPRARS